MKETATRTWTPPSRSRSAYPNERRELSDHWSTILAEQLHVVREPLRWRLRFGKRAEPRDLETSLRRAATGPCDEAWHTPDWLLPHQVDAARRIRASIEIFRGALLADAVGLGKTYVALAVAGCFGSAAVVVPAALVSQWKRVSTRVGVTIRTVTHEALSRNAHLPHTDLIVVDEAHRFRNPNTRRYARVARGVRRSRLLLLTATPVVNRASDLAHLLRLFCSDSSFSLLGMASIEKALSERDYALFTRAVAPAVVARSAESLGQLIDLLPQVRDATVSRACPTEQRVLTSLLDGVDSLEFPNVSDSRDYALLRLHLLHRLASSREAFRDTARRHLSYTERAIEAVKRGETLSRSLAQRIFRDEEDLQLALGDVAEATPEHIVCPATLQADRRRLKNILHLLSETNGASPKCEELARILEMRAGRKTIVFTTAVATALELARWLSWKHVAVVGAGKGWITSGRISVDEVLTLFAPNARGGNEPHRSMQVSTLIATDLASEGLDLQDADAVVHYDLPWTPLKLEQRVGRIARLGSTFRSSDVYWFAPPEELDRKLRLESRISQKVGDQLGLHVPVTSKVGRARIVNQGLDRRERFGSCTHVNEENGPRFAVLHGPPCAIVAIRWIVGDYNTPELITLSGRPPNEVQEFAIVESLLTRLLDSPSSNANPPGVLVECLLRVLRERLASSDFGDASLSSRRLTRCVLRRAREAGKRRERLVLVTLDGVLDKLRHGLHVGGERTLANALARRASQQQLAGWLDEQPSLRNGWPRFEIVAALFGDGSSAIP